MYKIFLKLLLIISMILYGMNGYADGIGTGDMKFTVLNYYVHSEKKVEITFSGKIEFEPETLEIYLLKENTTGSFTGDKTQICYPVLWNEGGEVESDNVGGSCIFNSEHPLISGNYIVVFDFKNGAAQYKFRLNNSFSDSINVEDFWIQEIKFDSFEGGEVTGTFNSRNTTTGEEVLIRLSIYNMEGAKIFEKDLNYINKNSEEQLSKFNIWAPAKYIPGEKYTFKIQIDPLNSISEYNEENNSKQIETIPVEKKEIESSISNELKTKVHTVLEKLFNNLDKQYTSTTNKVEILQGINYKLEIIASNTPSFKPLIDYIRPIISNKIQFYEGVNFDEVFNLLN